MSMLEESTQAVNRPMSGVFNNLVIFKQDVLQNSLRSIVSDLATSWSWNEVGTESPATATPISTKWSMSNPR